MRRLFFVTHADVVIDPDVPVPDWGLSARGRARHEAGAAAGYAQGITAVYASGEQKARDGGGILAAARGCALTVVEDLHENDRSATGYLPKEEFEAVADAFFASPDVSVRGWEPARDAQTRIVAAVTRIAATDQSDGDIAIVAHGGVGTLMLCHVMGIPIARNMDQPGAGGGTVFDLGLPDLQLIRGWRDLAED